MSVILRKPQDLLVSVHSAGLLGVSAFIKDLLRSNEVPCGNMPHQPIFPPAWYSAPKTSSRKSTLINIKQ